jgi:hypothetical protein
MNLLTISDCEFVSCVEDLDLTVLHDLLRGLVVDEQLGRSRTAQPGLNQRAELLVLHSMLLHNENERLIRIPKRSCYELQSSVAPDYRPKS